MCSSLFYHGTISYDDHASNVFYDCCSGGYKNVIWPTRLFSVLRKKTTPAGVYIYSNNNNNINIMLYMHL